MANNIRITRETTDLDALAQGILSQVLSYNASKAGPPNESKYVLTARTSDAELVAGLVGVQFWNGMFVELLWVDERFRGRGLGRQLMGQAETDLLDWGGEVIFLSTWSFQAPQFYEKLGYSAFGILKDMPRGSTRTWYVKWLHAA